MVLKVFLDEEDLIFPRAATRQGPKYQATVPSAPDPYNYPPGMCHSLHLKILRLIGQIDIEERGGDSTVEVLGVINSLTDAEGATP